MTNAAAPSHSTISSSDRFQWLDSVRGLAIIWIALFHFVLAYGGNYPWPISFSNLPTFVRDCSPTSLFGSISCTIEGLAVGLFQRGAQGVGVFTLFSGFGLTYALVRRGREPVWGSWYKQRLIRLLPLYWFAHLLFLVSPYAKVDPVDYRFILSFFGNRVYPIDEVFYYFVPAWWFIGMLLQFYIAFPVLYRLMQRLGAGKYLLLCIVLTAGSRYLIFGVLNANANYVQGGLFLCRLWEFATGMILGKVMAESPRLVLDRLFSPGGFIAGIVLYVLGQLAYRPGFVYSFSDGLTATGLSLIMIHVASWIDRIPGLGKTFAAAGIFSYSIYLFHQPYVMYFGERLRPYHIGIALTLSIVITAMVSLASGYFENSVNRLSDRYLKHR